MKRKQIEGVIVLRHEIPCMIMRGGTSKGVYLLDRDLPPIGEERDQLLLRLMGSPDIRQIDGLGCATSVTSKIAILAPSAREEAQVDYTFAQVSVDKPIVSYIGNCGNISSGVGPFAIESGLVQASSPMTTIYIFNTNTQKMMVESIQTPEGKVSYEGDYSIPGVPGTAALVKVTVIDPAGSVCGSLLPTGSPSEMLEVLGFGRLEISIVDATNPLVFVRAEDIGMTGKELSGDIDGNKNLLELLENIRGAAAKLLGLVENISDAAWETPGVPKMTIVTSPKTYITTDGEEISEKRIDLLGRMMSMQKAHPTYAMTGAMCTAVAAVIPGTVVYHVKRQDSDSERLRIAHPGGVLEVGVDYKKRDGQVLIQCVYGFRTVRLLLSGTAFVEVD